MDENQTLKDTEKTIKGTFIGCTIPFILHYIRCLSVMVLGEKPLLIGGKVIYGLGAFSHCFFIRSMFLAIPLGILAVIQLVTLILGIIKKVNVSKQLVLFILLYVSAFILGFCGLGQVPPPNIPD